MFKLSDFCWQDQTNSAECEPSDLRRTGGSPQTRTQQLITPGLMAFTLAHDYEDRCWRLKGQSSRNINKAGKKKITCEDASRVSYSSVYIFRKNKSYFSLAVVMNFLKYFSLCKYIKSVKISIEAAW